MPTPASYQQRDERHETGRLEHVWESSPVNEPAHRRDRQEIEPAGAHHGYHIGNRTRISI
jgi:hypothetical protein